MSRVNESINYYEKNAEMYYENTANTDFSIAENKFLGYLEANSLILDFGCGSGRDTKYFLSKNFRVEAVDGASEMCRLASDNTGINVKNISFLEFSEMAKFDGVWACASILHLDKEELKDVFIKVANSLKDRGIFYCSFKYGDYYGFRHGRQFTNMTESSIRELVDTNTLEIIEEWTSFDVRPNRGDERWLNVIMKKK